MNEPVEAESDIHALRKADFKVGLILLAVVLALLVHTFGFPMSGDYGGVENQWFVSPALFPLIVLSVLLICALILIARAVRDGGHQQLFLLRDWFGDFRNTVTRDKWYVIALLIFYIYIYVPSVDFYLATVLFLMSLMLRFYIGYQRLVIYILYTHYGLITLLLIIRYRLAEEFYFLPSYAASDESLILYSDIACGLAIAALVATFLVERRCARRKLINMLLACALVPLLLVIVFNYLLYVPMPVEYGSVMVLLNYLTYDLLQIR